MRVQVDGTRTRPIVVLLASLTVLVLAACSTDAPCPPGEDCRWLIDTPRVGLWSGLDPAPAAVLRVALDDRRVASVYVIWERCGAVDCSWTPPAAARRLVRQDNGVWVVALARSAFARDPASEVLVALADGSRARIGLSLGHSGARRPSTDDLPTCVADLTATLDAGAADAPRAVHDLEIELLCRIWLHPQQGRTEMRWHPALHEAARAHACDMAGRSYFSHTDPEGRGANARVRAAGYALPGWYDAEADGNNVESLALRSPHTTAASALQQWLDSPLHRRHVLAESTFNATHDDSATGYCVGERDGAPTHYWVFLSAQGTP